MARALKAKTRKKGPALVQSLCRAFDILEILADSETGLGVGKIARRMGLKTPTVHNLLRTLVVRSYAEQEPRTLLYRLGLGAFLLARGHSRAETLLRVALDQVEGLAERTGESSALGIWEGGGLVFIANIDSRMELAVRFGSGRATAHGTACGMALLAHLPAEELDAYIRRAKQSGSADDALLKPGALRRELARTRTRGISLLVRSGGGVSAVAAPIRDTSGGVVAAIGVSTPASRFRGNHRRLIEKEVRSAADVVSRRLGYSGRERRIAMGTG